MIQYCPQLEHPANLIVECFWLGDLNWQGAAMNGLKHQFLDLGSTRGAVKLGYGLHQHMDINIGTVPGLRYSSPWPWVLALGISLSMWAALVWLVRPFV
jgi:hypothetical protein